MFAKRYHSKSGSTHSNADIQAHGNMSKKHASLVRKKKRWGEFDRISDMITDPIVVFDTEFKVVNLNKAARHFFTGRPLGKKCFLIKHKFALACKDCPIWQTLKTGVTATSEILSPKSGDPILLKTYPVYTRLRKIKGVVMVGRESSDIPVKWKR